jgi:hypothetical protein
MLFINIKMDPQVTTSETEIEIEDYPDFHESF